MTWPTDVWMWDSRQQAYTLKKPTGSARVWCDRLTNTWWTGKVLYKDGSEAWLSSKRDVSHVQAQAEALLGKERAA
jgi:hypothetical protein